LISDFGKPIVSTSANFHGGPSPAKFSDIPRELVDGACATFDNPENTGETIPSTIVDLSGKAPVMLREGKNLENVKKILKI
jgi:L-threonylcarbamoyladenylate synthase